MPEFATIPGVVQVERIGGWEAEADTPYDLLVEVPHGADRRSHYDALRARLVGDYPEDLHAFFHVNTDVGAWQLGREIAGRVVAARPWSRALVLRSLIPRTFVDCNRVAGVTSDGSIQEGAMTPAMPPYVRDPADRALLADLHAQYVGLAEAAYDAVCGRGGFALNPHTYGPRTLAIDAIDDDIVANLRRAHEPAVLEASPLRPEVDLIARTEDGTDYAPEGSEAFLREGLATLGLSLESSETYFLHPATQGYRFTLRHPRQVLGFEVRRDLLVEDWAPFEEQAVSGSKVARTAGVFVDYVVRWLQERG